MRSELKRIEELYARDFVSASALDARRTAVEAAAIAERAARAQADSVANQTAYAELRAVEAGVVTAVLAEPGSVLPAGQPVVRFARPGEREMLIHVSESRLAHVRIGALATTVTPPPAVATVRTRQKSTRPSDETGTSA